MPGIDSGSSGCRADPGRRRYRCNRSVDIVKLAIEKRNIGLHEISQIFNAGILETTVLPRAHVDRGVRWRPRCC